LKRGGSFKKEAFLLSHAVRRPLKKRVQGGPLSQCSLVIVDSRGKSMKNPKASGKSNKSKNDHT